MTNPMPESMPVPEKMVRLPLSVARVMLSFCKSADEFAVVKIGGEMMSLMFRDNTIAPLDAAIREAEANADGGSK